MTYIYIRINLISDLLDLLDLRRALLGFERWQSANKGWGRSKTIWAALVVSRAAELRSCLIESAHRLVSLPICIAAFPDQDTALPQSPWDVCDFGEHEKCINKVKVDEKIYQVVTAQVGAECKCSVTL